jgi:hypothetical protein
MVSVSLDVWRRSIRRRPFVATRHYPLDAQPALSLDACPAPDGQSINRAASSDAEHSHAINIQITAAPPGGS